MKTPSGEDGKASYLEKHLDKFCLAGRTGFRSDLNGRFILVDVRSLHGNGILHKHHNNILCCGIGLIQKEIFRDPPFYRVEQPHGDVLACGELCKSECTIWCGPALLSCHCIGEVNKRKIRLVSHIRNIVEINFAVYS